MFFLLVCGELPYILTYIIENLKKNIYVRHERTCLLWPIYKYYIYNSHHYIQIGWLYILMFNLWHKNQKTNTTTTKTKSGCFFKWIEFMSRLGFSSCCCCCFVLFTSTETANNGFLANNTPSSSSSSSS